MNKKSLIFAILILLLASPAGGYTCADSSCSSDVQARLNYLEYLGDNNLGVIPLQMVRNQDTASEWSTSCPGSGGYCSRIYELQDDYGGNWIGGIGGVWWGGSWQSYFHTATLGQWNEILTQWEYSGRDLIKLDDDTAPGDCA